MPATSLCINGQNLVALSLPDDKCIFIELFKADENFKPVGEPERLLIPDVTEEQWHKQLRKDASVKNQYVKEYSTDRNWDDPIEEVITKPI